MISKLGSYVGMIIPVSAVCTDGYAPLQNLLKKSGASIISNFNDRPSKLFDGIEHNRLCIILHKKTIGQRYIYSTTFNKWHSVERKHLFQRLSFIETTDLNRSGCLAKIGESNESSILNKIKNENGRLSEYNHKNEKFSVYYTRKLSHFVQILDFTPQIYDEMGDLREPSELKILSFSKKIEREIYLAILNSTTFYWLLTVYSDCRNLNKREVDSVCFDFNRANPEIVKKISRFSRLLMDDIKKNSKVLEMNYKKIGQLKIQCTYPRFSKKIIDQIDALLAEHYRLSAEELDFIINYDIKYRIGS